MTQDVKTHKDLDSTRGNMAYNNSLGFSKQKGKNVVEIPKLKDLASLAAPEAIEDEWGVMACILNSETPNDIFLQVAQILEPKHFALPLLQDIWRIMLDMHSKYLPINFSVFQSYIEDFEQKNKLFFEEFLPKMYESTHEEDSVKFYAERILTKYQKRSIMNAFSEGIASAASHMLPEDALAEVERKLSEVRQEIHYRAKKSGSSVRALLSNYLVDLQEQAAGTKAGGTINTQSWYDFNQASQGFAPGDFIVVAAPTSCGKSMTGIGLARELALEGHSVLYASLEMTQRTVLERIMAPVIGFSAGAMSRTGQITESKLASIREFNDKYADLPICIKKPHQNSYDSFIKSAAEAEAEFRELKGDDFQGFRVVIVDYLQLLAANVPSQFKVQEIDRVSQLLRNYALENGCTVVALAQYDTETSKSGKEPDSLNSLSYCKTIDHHATQVVMMWHPYFADRQKLHEAKYIDFLWMKNRDGSNDRVRMGVDWTKGWLFSLSGGYKPPARVVPDSPKEDPLKKLSEKYGGPTKKANVEVQVVEEEVELEPLTPVVSDDPMLALAQPKGVDATVEKDDPLVVDTPPPAESLPVPSADFILIAGTQYAIGEEVNYAVKEGDLVPARIVRLHDKHDLVIVEHLDSRAANAQVREYSGKAFLWKTGDLIKAHPSRIQKT